MFSVIEPFRRPGALEKAGGWLFRQRTWLPLPIAAAILLIPAEQSRPSLSTSLAWLGVPAVAIGELLRLWAVHHIGVISRTRSDRLGPLIVTGPFSIVRNPLYVGNILLWAGFAVSARLGWLAPLVVLLLMLEYHAIVRWEERLLESRLGDGYRAYTLGVPRWLPRFQAPTRAVTTAPFSWGETLFSERGTLIAIAFGYLLLWLKTQL
jgi:protein-S-isoprenylcysteine O-methyltransferase Ste14